ncbi:MAG TPA: HD domain-containing protein [Thermotogota bacterium]|nr:HD domain-containing protein [Thermotogota bacterium]HPJ87679.1 HD domain-containing protein [Thermotogota bacterium]HPR94882.1 HD domain-containing protein [Thermotogota bacterium]
MNNLFYSNDLLSDICKYIQYENTDSVFLSEVGTDGRHTLYQVSISDAFPPHFEEQISRKDIPGIFREKTPSIVDELPLRYVTQRNVSKFAEMMIRNKIFAQLRIPLCRVHDKMYFLILLSKENPFYDSVFKDFIQQKIPLASQRVSDFFGALEQIKNFFTSYRKILELKGDETFPHMQRVGDCSYKIAIELWYIAKKLKRDDILEKLNPFSIEALRLAATIHDIGKLAIPENVLNKPGKLTRVEFEVIKQHSQKGLEIIEAAFPEKKGFNGRKGPDELTTIISLTKEIIYEHHERLDGSGYPRGLKDGDIGLFSKIVSVADVFDAITSRRVYKEERSIDFAIEEIKENQKEKFDPLIIEAFLRTQNKSLLQVGR